MRPHRVMVPFVCRSTALLLLGAVGAADPQRVGGPLAVGAGEVGEGDLEAALGGQAPGLGGDVAVLAHGVGQGAHLAAQLHLQDRLGLP